MNGHDSHGGGDMTAPAPRRKKTAPRGMGKMSGMGQMMGGPTQRPITRATTKPRASASSRPHIHSNRSSSGGGHKH